MKKINALYAQSGGVTSVINATAAAVIETARNYPDKINKLYAAKNGVLGILKEELYDTSLESAADIAALKYTPSGVFGSCRYKIGSIDKDLKIYKRVIDIFAAHNIKYFFYNGGGDSQDTALKISQISQTLDYPITCIGIPKTIDNDLPITDCSPGYGSAAKYIAVSTKEASLDVRAMSANSTKVFILEVMGRHSGWLAAAGGLASLDPSDGPHIILFPEVAFSPAKFLQKVKLTVEKYGYCTVVVSEGLRNHDGSFVSDAGVTDAFGHKQLGGVASVLASLIKKQLQLRHHWAIADYLQRSARHIASLTDLQQAIAVGEHAVELALSNKNAHIPIVVRTSDDPYRWHVDSAQIKNLANIEVGLPGDYITNDGFGITEKCRARLQPLISGEAYPPYENGVPNYVRLKNILVEKKLENYFEIL